MHCRRVFGLSAKPPTRPFRSDTSDSTTALYLGHSRADMQTDPQILKRASSRPRAQSKRGLSGYRLLGMALLGLIHFTCRDSREVAPEDWELTTAWADLTLDLTRRTPANTPTYASRCLGYMGLTMYLSVAPGARTLAAELNGMTELPIPEPGYRPALGLNAAQAELLRRLYPQTSPENLARVDSLERAMERRLEGGDTDTDRRSAEHGRAIATQVAAWAEGDGGHRGYLVNFDKTWTHPTPAGHWQPPLFAQSFSHHPLHPHWGNNRFFLASDTALPTPPPPAYDTTVGSAYYEQFRTVYEKGNALTADEKAAALWWGDDPDETFTPPGHSYHLARLAVAGHRADLQVGAETFARVGISVAEAFIHCWKMKFMYFTERPNTFINAHIDPTWESFWPDPPFPAYPSGHALQAAATARVLEDLYGPEFAFTDEAHVGRPRDEVRAVDFGARAYTSFWEVATETADSRFFGGIHIPADNETGLALGELVAANVNALPW